MTLSFKPLRHSAEVLGFLRMVGEQESALFRPEPHHCVKGQDATHGTLTPVGGFGFPSAAKLKGAAQGAQPSALGRKAVTFKLIEYPLCARLPTVCQASWTS